MRIDPPSTRVSVKLLLGIAMSVACCAAAMASVGAIALGAPRPRASAAATGEISMHETLVGHPVGRRSGSEYSEQGQGSGTFNCPLTVHIKIYYTQAAITFTCNPRGGTISGRGEESFYIAGSTTYFKGAMSFTGGTGRYAHISSSGIYLRGTVQRGTYALSATISGRVRP